MQCDLMEDLRNVTSKIRNFEGNVLPMMMIRETPLSELTPSRLKCGKRTIELIDNFSRRGSLRIFDSRAHYTQFQSIPHTTHNVFCSPTVNQTVYCSFEQDWQNTVSRRNIRSANNYEVKKPVTAR